MARYTIDELAQASGITARNIRTYQTEELLPPPAIEGRVGFYDDGHLARLRLVRNLQDRGYSRAAIRDLLAAWERGESVGEVLGLEAVLLRPWGDEPELRLTHDELVARYGDDPVQRQRALDLGVLRADDGGGWVAPSRMLFEAGEALLAAGVPLDAVLDLTEAMVGAAVQIADAFVSMFARWFVPVAGDPHEWFDAMRSNLEGVRGMPGRAAGSAVELVLDQTAEQFAVELMDRRRGMPGVSGGPPQPDG